jgi:hypothetical protein
LLQLLEGVLGLVDALLVFQEGPGEEWVEMAMIAFGEFQWFVMCCTSLSC